MDRIRLRFSKTGKAAYISHLDLIRTVQRALNRANVPIRYSEGFNPHALISILLPLPVGMESLCELADIRVNGELDLITLPALLTDAMPEGLRVTDAWEGGLKSTCLKWLRVHGVFQFDDGESSGRIPALYSFFAQPNLPVLRKTKRGEGEFDLKSAIQEVAVAEDADGVSLTAVLSAQDPTVNPELLAAALRRHEPALAPDFARFVRLETFQADMSIFR